MISGRVLRGPGWPAALYAVVLVLAAPVSSFGQTLWTAATGDWNAPGNWTLGVPDAGSPAAFDAVIENGGTAQLFDPGASVRRLRVGRAAGGGNLEVNGGGLTVTDDFHLNEGGAGLATTTVRQGGTVTVPTAVVGYSGNGPAGFSIIGPGSRVDATSGFEIGRAGNADLTLSDGGTLSVGGGTLPLRVGTLAGGFGTVNIGQGVVAAGVLEASAVEFGVGGGALRFDHTGDLTFATPITGPGSVTKLGPDTMTFSATNSYTGATRLNGGTLVISADANLGTPPAAFTPDQLRFNGGTLRATESFTVPANRGAQFSIGGGTIEVDATKTLTYPIHLALSAGTMAKTGAGSLALNRLTVGFTGSAAVTVTGGGALDVSGSTAIGYAGNANGSVIISGPGTTLTTTDLMVGQGARGSLEILGGATLTTTYGSIIAGATGSSGIATVRGLGSSWNVGGDLTFAYGSSATLNIEDQALVDVGGTLRLLLGVLNLSGGTLRLNDLQREDPGTFRFHSGTVQLPGDRSIGTDAAIAELLGPAPTLSTGQRLTVEGTATLRTAVTLDGGTLTVAGLIGGSSLRMIRGTLNVDGDFTVGPGGPLGAAVTLGRGQALNVLVGSVRPGALLLLEDGGAFSAAAIANDGSIVLDGASSTLAGGTLDNAGVLRGDGRVTAAVNNLPAGEIRAEQGKHLWFTAPSGPNEGRVTLQGGSLQFGRALTNAPTGVISGRGTLFFDGGLTNQGRMQFSGGPTDIYGDVSLTGGAGGGEMINSGSANVVSFYGDVTHNGDEVRTSPTNTTVFFGTVGGAGPFTGSGDVRFEGAFAPGNSPASVVFQGSVILTSESRLEIELAGPAPGTQHDQLLIAGAATLDGTLQLALIDGFAPAPGQTFEVVTAAAIEGRFQTYLGLRLSDLPGGKLRFFDPRYSATALTLHYIEAFAGDATTDGRIDVGDYYAIDRGYALGLTGWVNGDFDLSGGPPDADDYALLDHAFLAQQLGGLAAPAVPAAAAHVPEPSALLWVAPSAIALAGRRRRRPSAALPASASSPRRPGR